MSLVADASVVVASLADDGSTGRWARSILSGEPLLAPHLMPFEAANILRRSVLRGDLSEDLAQLTHADLLDLPVTLVDYLALAARAWQLRSTVTVYDAAYVALAEEADAPLATLDLRLSRAPGPTCAFLTPPDRPGL